MTIPYTYTVLNVNEDARVMELVYSSPNYPSVHVSTRLPYEGETLETIAAMYAPLRLWQEQDIKVVVPEVGLVGTSAPPIIINPTISDIRLQKLAELADSRYQYETSGVTIAGATIATDRASQAAIAGAYSSLKNGLLTSIDWKGADGNWITLTADQITAIATAVATHVQRSFTLERSLSEQVNAADTIEKIKAIVWPT